MASQFKIPKKKQPEDADSAHLHMQSPLSRLQSSAPEFKGYRDQSGRGSADRMHAGSSVGSTNRQSTPCKPFFKDVVKTLLGLNSPSRGASAANHRAAGGLNHQSQKAESSSVGFSNGWRPKRASDRLLQPDVTSERPSPPPQKKKSDSSGSSQASRRISVASVDTLAELRGDEHAGSLSSSTWRRAELKSDGRNSPESLKNSSVSGSDDDFVSPSRTRNKPSPEKPLPSSSSSSSSSSVSSVTAGPSSTATPDRRRSLERTSWLAASSNLRGDPREKKRERWREFRERKKTPNRSAVLHLRLRKAKQTPSEPIVLSSEEEEEGEDDADGGKKTSRSSGRPDESQNSEHKQAQQVCPSRDEADEHTAPPSFLQLEFVSLHAGLTHADANGKMMITENGITLPLKGEEEEGEVTVVASQVRGYGVWDGGVAQGGPLLDDWEGPAPSLLFLWVTDAQANLLQRELTAIQTAAASGPSCSFLLLVLKEQLQELQAALLASILDMEEFRRGRSSSSSGGPTSPLDWTDGLLLLHSCPPPLDQHLLRLLGHCKEMSGQVRSSHRNKKSNMNSSGLQQLPTRLIQYPAAPCKGRITVTKEDLACLNDGEFLNDVIIDFYLKFLLLEGVGGSVAERSHVFSSFFYKQLSRRRAAGEGDAPSVPDRHTRHQRVKTWTRHVDIFTKDFLFVPVNQEAHWYLVVVCFPGLEEVRYEERQSRTGDSGRPAGNRVVSLRSQQLPECTQQGWQRDKALKRPCILVMDSLKLSYHENVCRLLRDYLQVEWEVRRGTPRLFTSDSMRSFNCRVPQQDNSSDCGLYLLQYVESFLQNPVVHFDLPTRLDNWFPRQRVRQKREEIGSLIMRMHESQQQNDRRTKTNKNKER
ncbi:sentrin-specific protease 7b [Thunnus maccoyii]|uniref:sentrin-specific protease 7b n=1 Tax=Thunnus maccoyii TaxID=8240 RepID=UPI001C4D82EE|nr:sentrin-specific protease 7b [Thunnus maccoyii]